MYSEACHRISGAYFFHFSCTFASAVAKPIRRNHKAAEERHLRRTVLRGEKAANIAAAFLIWRLHAADKGIMGYEINDMSIMAFVIFLKSSVKIGVMRISRKCLRFLLNPSAASLHDIVNKARLQEKA